jgi:hypothetical protein
MTMIDLHSHRQMPADVQRAQTRHLVEQVVELRHLCAQLERDLRIVAAQRDRLIAEMRGRPVKRRWWQWRR